MVGSFYYNARLQAALNEAVRERNITQSNLEELVFGLQDKLGESSTTPRTAAEPAHDRDRGTRGHSPPYRSSQARSRPGGRSPETWRYLPPDRPGR